MTFLKREREREDWKSAIVVRERERDRRLEEGDRCNLAHTRISLFRIFFQSD
jgi:hypothetical protein